MNRVWLVLAGSLLIAPQAQAQTMYRCGSVYQDRPCDAGKTGKVVGSTGTGGSASATPASGIDPECVQRGRDSNKIVWAREGGATQERLMSEAASARERRLIEDVYRRPGAASTVQAAVETDCVAEKKRDEERAALAIAAALKARREGGDTGMQTSTVQASPDPSAQDPAAQLAAPQRAERQAEYKKQQCAAYSEDMERLRSRERAGGSARTMDSLNERRRSLREQMHKAGC
jgi:hypothetical protein